MLRQQMSWEVLLLWWRARRSWLEARQMLWVELSLHEANAIFRHTESGGLVKS